MCRLLTCFCYLNVEMKNITILYHSISGNVPGEIKPEKYECNIKTITGKIKQEEYIELLNSCTSETLLWIDADRVAGTAVSGIIHRYLEHGESLAMGYVSHKKANLFLGSIRNSWRADPEILNSPVFIGRKTDFLKAYAGDDLSENLFTAIGYSLQKQGAKFCRLEANGIKIMDRPTQKSEKLLLHYTWGIPGKYLISAKFFKDLLGTESKVQRDMVFRMLLTLFAVFLFLYMPFISQDYGISGDEFVDQRHSGYVIDYFTKGDTAALNQPKTALHLYGINVQVIAEAICRTFQIDDVYAVRHILNASVGALGIWITGLLALRWGGGLCGLLGILMMFFTPRYFGHSMNNLKDIPFAVGYIMSIYYFIRLFDHYPYFKLRYIIGAVMGIFLALGTRSGGLMLFPYLLMYGGLFYVLRVGVREFWKFVRYQNDISRILSVIFIVLILGYFISLLLWPYALEKPLTRVFVSLEQFTNYNIGLRTIFEGTQMMSNMLPWHYAPKYLLIGLPLIVVVGFLGYLLYIIIRRKEFTLISYFLLFAAIFPVFWVIYKHSNLYGGIRHLLFVIPVIVVVAARFWVLLMNHPFRSVRIVVALLWIGGLALPMIHMIKNHPNDYVYFNELAGGLKGAYGDYETDYYYNSLKNSSDWFKKNMTIPKDKKTTIVTNHTNILSYYFKADTNVRVIYSRYYEKYSKDWDYAIFANVYINRHQLKSGLFPPEEKIYSSNADGFPMSVVLKRETKQDLQGFMLEKEKKYPEALNALGLYALKHPKNEEVLSKMSKLYYMTGDLQKSAEFGERAQQLHPSLNETLYILTLVYLQQNRYQEAMASAQAILNENEFSPDGYYLRAVVYNAKKDYKEAVNNINKVLSIRPQHDGALALGGEILFNNGNYKAAADIYRKLLDVRKGVKEVVALADCYCRLQDYKQVEQLLAEVNKVQQAYLPAYKVRLRMMIQTGNSAEASHLIEQLGQISNDAELYVLRALFYNMNNQRGKALAELDKALKLNASQAEALKLKNSWEDGFKGKA